jgi:hypothetical protein
VASRAANVSALCGSASTMKDQGVCGSGSGSGSAEQVEVHSMEAMHSRIDNATILMLASFVMVLYVYCTKCTVCGFNIRYVRYSYT